MVIDDHDFIHLAKPLLGEHSNGGRTTADAHPLFAHAIDDGRLSGLHDDRRAVIDLQFRRFSIAQIEQSLTRNCAFLAASAGKVANAAKREHLRTVFAGSYVADGFALRAHGIGFGPEIAIGIDLHFDATVTEDALGHDRHHVHRVDRGGNDERSRFVVGIGRSCPDGRHECSGLIDEVAVPVLTVLQEGDDGLSARNCLIEQHVGIEPNQLSIVIGVAVARSGPAGLDVTENRAGVTADGVIVTHGDLRGLARPEWQHGSDQALLALCECERQWRRESR